MEKFADEWRGDGGNAWKRPSRVCVAVMCTGVRGCSLGARTFWRQLKRRPRVAVTTPAPPPPTDTNIIVFRRARGVYTTRRRRRHYNLYAIYFITTAVVSKLWGTDRDDWFFLFFAENVNEFRLENSPPLGFAVEAVMTTGFRIAGKSAFASNNCGETVVVKNDFRLSFSTIIYSDWREKCL